MKGAVKNLEGLVGKDWKKVENWTSLYKKENEWEKKAREEIKVKVRKYDEREKRRQEERREEKGELIIYNDGSKKEEGTVMQQPGGDPKSQEETGHIGRNEDAQDTVMDVGSMHRTAILRARPYKYAIPHSNPQTHTLASPAPPPPLPSPAPPAAPNRAPNAG